MSISASSTRHINSASQKIVSRGIIDTNINKVTWADAIGCLKVNKSEILRSPRDAAAITIAPAFDLINHHFVVLTDSSLIDGK
jgi:hypothetical protein